MELTISGNARMEIRKVKLKSLRTGRSLAMIVIGASCVLACVLVAWSKSTDGYDRAASRELFSYLDADQHTNHVRRLLEAHANPNFRRSWPSTGMTPLHLAA